MRFPSSEKLHLPCRFEQFVPGRLHADGRRYLPLIILRMPEPPSSRAPEQFVQRLGVVDRHHVVAPEHAGRDGVARLVLLLSTLHVQHAPFREGLQPEAGLAEGRASTAPVAFGQVREVLTWQVERGHLPYESLYAELRLDIGVGMVGVRTSMTAPDLAAAIGTAQVQPGDWLEVRRSRVDMLGFEPMDERMSG